jgi:Transposase
MVFPLRPALAAKGALMEIIYRRCAGLDVSPRKALPGHKTDRVDAAHIAELAEYYLVRASFVPPGEIRELRDPVRRRVPLTDDRNRVSRRNHWLLELQNAGSSGTAGHAQTGAREMRAAGKGAALAAGGSFPVSAARTAGGTGPADGKDRTAGKTH